MPLNISVIGTGHMGRIHLDKLMSMADVNVSGIVDIDNNIGKNLKERYNVPFFKDYMDIIDLSNGVIISTPTDTHYSIAKKFLENNVHVFIEKPIASNIDEASALIEIAEKKGVVLQVGHLERFNPSFIKARQYIEKPLIVEARRTSNFTGRSVDIDAVLDLMIHDIDLLLSIVQSDVAELKTYGFQFVSDKFDLADTTIKFKNGCIATLYASRISTKKERTFTILEKNKTIFIDLLNGNLTCNLKKIDGTIESLEYKADKIDSVKEELKEFVESVMGKHRPTVNGKDGLKALEMADLIRNSIG